MKPEIEWVGNAHGAKIADIYKAMIGARDE